MPTRNIVPRATGEGSIGTAAKHWGAGHFDSLPNWQEYLAESTGYGIVSGCEPSISGLTVTVGAGTVHLADGTRKELSATNITLDNADSTNPRIDLVYIDSTGVVAKITGTAAASPVVPTLPSGGISVCNVSVAAGATTGTVTDKRSMLPRFYNTGIVNVKDYGAVGDGITDDTKAIQAAINAGNIIIFPIGEYYITSSIEISRSNVIICGENAVINANSTNSAYSFIFKSPVANADSALYEGTLRVSNIRMKGVTIKDDTACVAILNVDDFVIENCNVTANNEAFNIRFCKNYNVSNNVITSNDGVAYGIFNYQSKKFIEENNRITANLCIVVKGSYNQEEYVDAIIAGNYLNVLTSSGTGISSGSVVEEGAVKRCIAKNNYIYTYGANTSEYGITLSRKAEEWVVSENIIIGGNINVCANNHVIKGNVIRNAKIASIRVAPDVDALNSSCIIENNYLMNNTVCAIELNAGSKHIVVGNYMNNCKNGIVIAGGVTENIIINNYGVEQDYVIKTNDATSGQYTVNNFSINNNAGQPVGTNTTGLSNSNLIYYNKNSIFKEYGYGGYRGVNGWDRLSGINLYDSNKSKEYHMWIDSSGRLRIHNDVPTSDNDGTVVGTQS